MTQKTVKAYSVLCEVAEGKGAYGGGDRIYRFRTRKEAEAFVVGKMLYGSCATVDEDDVPRNLAARWGLAAR